MKGMMLLCDKQRMMGRVYDCSTKYIPFHNSYFFLKYIRF